MFGHSLEAMLETSERPVYGPLLFEQMMRDINGGGNNADPMTQAVYAMGYNLAIEYMADYEKTWMLESFRQMDSKFMAAQGCNVDWVFLQVCVCCAHGDFRYNFNIQKLRLRFFAPRMCRFN